MTLKPALSRKIKSVNKAWQRNGLQHGLTSLQAAAYNSMHTVYQSIKLLWKQILQNVDSTSSVILVYRTGRKRGNQKV